MFKKIIKLALLISLTFTLFIPLALAENGDEPSTKTTVSSQELFDRFQTKDGTAPPKTAAVAALPNSSWQATLASIVVMLLNITGALALISFTVGGVMMVVGGQNPDMLEKGKKIVMYSLIGLVIIAASYAIVLGVSQLEFFTTSVPNE